MLQKHFLGRGLLSDKEKTYKPFITEKVSNHITSLIINVKTNSRMLTFFLESNYSNFEKAIFGGLGLKIC